MRILVTGGAGLIGSHLCDRLIAQNNTVFCIDNFFTSSRQNICHLLENPNFYLIQADISKPVNFKTQVDQIYNLACPASPVHYQRDPVFTIETCINGMQQMLEMARDLKVPILQASTSEIYGDPKEHPQSESYFGNVNPFGPRSVYDEGKRAAESLCFAYYKQYDVDAKIVRIFNTYGPRMAIDDGRVISNFIIKALNNEPLEIYGKGDQTRSFQYVDDLINGLQVIMDSNLNEPINLGNPEEITINELASNIANMIGIDLRIINRPFPQNDPLLRKPDITKAMKLGWRPAISIKKGIDKTIQFFRESLSIS
jgi:UDP-glucuronate decarboxylase